MGLWPAAIIFAFCVQAVTGFFLWTYYSPSAQTAWESVYFLQYEVAGGWLLRAIHHYSAHVLLAMLILYLVQSILTGSYRAPRELVFWATVGLGLAALAAVITGDLLSWDQNGYAATKTRTGFLTLIPWVGESLLKIAIGGPGPALGHLSLTRFFALHVGVFAGGFAVLLWLRGLLARRADAAQLASMPNSPLKKGATTNLRSVPGLPSSAERKPRENTDGRASSGTQTDESRLFQQAARAACRPRMTCCKGVVCLLVMAVVLLLAFRHGATLPQAGVPLGSPADTDPANAYDAARPEWFLLGVYEFSHLFTGPWQMVPIFIVPGLLVCVALAMPLIGRSFVGRVFNVGFTAFLLIALAGLSYVSLAKDRADPLHQKAIVAEVRQAERVRELARHEGIPPTGALTLLKNDPKTQGPRLFVQQCASCHDHAGESYVGGDDIKAEKPTAPNLNKFGSREWLAGLLDPERISGPEYFGNTKFRAHKMAGFVKETLGDLDEDEKENVKKVVMALSAEAKLPSQRAIDAGDAKAIEEGRKLIVDDFGCIDCHKFHDKGQLGDAPELTGWGSPQWLSGIIRDPTDKHFYGKLNDRMPAYAASIADPAQNTFSPRQIELMTNWLRGEWYEEVIE